MNDEEVGPARSQNLTIAILYCQYAVMEGLNLAVELGACKDLVIQTQMLPCSSKIAVSHLMKMLDGEADAVEVVACPVEACRMLVGSRRAERRINYVQQLLSEAGLEPERVGLTRDGKLGVKELIELARKRADACKGEPA